jgi:hypothetical protein
MNICWRRLLPLAVALATSVDAHLAAQTTVVQNPNGGASQVTIQGDGSGNTLIFTQTVSGGPAPAGGAPAGAAGGVVFGAAAGVPADGAMALPPRDQQQPPAVGTSRIRGRIVASDSGRPIRRAVVRLSSAAVRESRSTSTDQDGRFEFTQLPAGAYNISASKSGYVQMGYKQTRPNAPPRPVTVGEREVAERIDIALPPGGVITGRIVDEFGDPVSDVFVAAQRQQYSNNARRPVSAGSPSGSNDIGEFRIYGLSPGDYYVAATPRAQGSPIETSTDRTGYALTYYPATPDVSAAQRIHVSAGDTVSNIVIALTLTRTARISGTVLDGEGRPARGGNVMVTSRASGPGTMPTANAFVRQDGSFTVTGVAPGDYTLRAFINGPQQGGLQRPSTLSTANVTVTGTDVNDLILQPQAPTTVSGRLTGQASTLAQIKPATARLAIVPMGGPMIMPGPMPPPPALRDDLSFELVAYPGTFALRPMSLPGVIIRSVRLNGRDVTREFDIAPGAAITDLEVEVTASAAKVAVTVANARGEAAADQDVVVFPQDESEWGTLMPGHASSGRTDERGQYQSPQLLPGAYYVVTSDALEPGDANDPEILTNLRARAQRITLGDGETAAVQLRTSAR